MLIDRNKNSSLSNKNYETKKLKYQGSIEARANTNFVMMNYNDWTTDSIVSNQLRIVDLLMNYYRGNSLKTYLDIQKI